MDFFMKWVNAIELYLVYSPNKFIYSGFIFVLVQIFLLRRYIVRKSQTTLLLIVSFCFVYVNFILPWQNYPFL